MTMNLDTFCWFVWRGIYTTLFWRVIMKIVLLIYIGFLTILGYITQMGLSTSALTIAFIVLNIVCVPIIMAFLLKFYFSFSIRTKP